MRRSSAEKIVLRLGRLMENIPLSPRIGNESNLEYAVLPHIKKFVQKELAEEKALGGVLYYHGRNKKEKKRWTESKLLQTVKLFGTNMFIVHPMFQKIGAVSLEFKYAKLLRTGEGLTGSIQRAIGQSLIATLRHPFAICTIVYGQQKKHLEIGALEQLKNLLWKQHKIYLVIRNRCR